METVLLETFGAFRPENLSHILSKLRPEQLVHSPYVIGTGLFIFLLMLYKRMFQFIALAFCGVSLYFISNHFSTPGRNSITPENITVFVGISVAVILIAIYVFLVRSE